MSKSKSERIQFPRSLAVRVLVSVLSKNEPLDEALARAAADVPPTILPWLQEICSGTLRWKGRLDWILDSVSFKKKPSGWLRKVLLLAAYQIVVQDRTPAAVVVSETVSEVKAQEGEAPAKFANACLRKIAEHASEWRNLPFPGGNEPNSDGDPRLKGGGKATMSSQVNPAQFKEQAAWASMPEWIWAKLVYQQGLDWAKAYALASLDRPVLWVRSKKDMDLELAVKGPVPESWQLTSGGAVPDRPGFSEGSFFVQDISSQFLVAEVVKRIREKIPANQPRTEGPGGELSRQDLHLTALDLCAAPGGKAVGLAWSGFQVTATDRTASRVALLQDTVKRTAPGIQVVPWESVDPSRSESGTAVAPNLVWIDAPCSGTGILRRHPDVRWLRSEKELISLVKTQRELLKAAWEKVPSGGFLVYSVCSILKEEGPQAIKHLNLEAFVIDQWLLCPQEAPHGDGFWAVLLGKG